MRSGYGLIGIIVILLSPYLPAIGTTQHHTYFSGTDYALDVYRIQGERSGKTLLIIGGIQGDEPGGYRAADRYVDVSLSQGQLIIVPRANLKAIMLGQRGPDGDMNRQFHDQPWSGPMLPVVRKIQRLIAEADVLLNLHEGWGYHRPTYVDAQRNPDRYGQSLIVDADVYTCADGTQLSLGKIGQKVLRRVNQQIADPAYHLHYFNTRTGKPDTSHSAMRKTATYYALRQHCIPAFGVESSKNLPDLATKIKYQQLVINAFMQHLNILPQMPADLTTMPDWVVARVLVAGVEHWVRDGDQLLVPPGASVTVEGMQGNYRRGYTADILQYGGLQDQQRRVRIRQDTELVLRHDQRIVGRVQLRVSQTQLGPPYFIVEKNGQPLIVSHNQVMQLARTDQMVIRTSLGQDDPVAKINFKGWVPPGVYNRGDDRGYKIMARDRLQTKYSVRGRGKLYPVVAQNAQGRVVARFYVRITEY
ncbi:MAG: M14/M99 family metallopeptidase [Pseudomonadota bacterium]